MRNYGKVMPHQQLKGPPPQDTGGRGVESNNRPRVHSGMTLYVSLGFVKTSAVHFNSLNHLQLFYNAIPFITSLKIIIIIFNPPTTLCIGAQEGDCNETRPGRGGH
jgi:hypothetical protein